jgi:hypothetical protein
MKGRSMRQMVFDFTRMSINDLLNLGNRMKSVIVMCKTELQLPQPDKAALELATVIDSGTFVLEQILEEFDTRGI